MDNDLDDIFANLSRRQKETLPFSDGSDGFDCDMEQLEPACINCGMYYDCLVGGEKDVRFFYCDEYVGKE